MQRSWMLGGVGGLLLASMLWARPGIVKTMQGQTFSGDVVEQDDQVTVDVKGIHTTIARGDLQSITYADSIERDYHKRLAKLTPYDVAGRVELAQWLFENKSYNLALDVLADAQKIQPRNEQVAQMILTVGRQVDLDEREARKNAPAQLAAADGGAHGALEGAAPAKPAAAPALGRLLTPGEINFIKQSEWEDGQQIRPTFKNDVRRKYAAQQGINPAVFNRQSPSRQAWAIIHDGTPEMKKDVILSDPPAILQFKKIERSVLSVGCAACHDATHADGRFALHFPAEGDAATYANFMILQKFNVKIGDRLYSMIDRERPSESLLLQFSLPPALGNPPHPKTPNYKGAVRTRNDPRVKPMLDWITSLTPIVPDYGDIDPWGPAPKPEDKPAK